MSDDPSQPARYSRRVRREQARQLAKEMLKSQGKASSARQEYSTDFLWGLIFFLGSVAWPYIFPEGSPPVIVLAWVMWSVAFFFVARLFFRWSRDKHHFRFAGFLIVVVAATFAYWAATSIWRITRPTYLYVVPTRNLIDAERRAFFVMQAGPQSLSNVEISIRDNKAGTVQREKFAEIDSGPQNPLAPRYIWLKPSTPWDEDYTVTVTSSKKPRAIQRLIVRGTHRLVQFATDISVDGKSTPVIECRDPLLPTSYDLARSSDQSCDKLMGLPSDVEDRLEPSPYNVKRPDGSVTLKRLKAVTPQSGAESQSDTRRLSEWQRGTIVSGISQHAGKRILIMASTGSNTWSYAQGFRDVFVSSGWKVEGPKAVPAIDELIIDVQLSANGILGVPQKPEEAAVMNSFTQAGIKHREHLVLDSDINPGLLVLWVGAKSPEGISPDDCSPISFKPKPGGAKPCALVSQARAVPIPPP